MGRSRVVQGGLSSRGAPGAQCSPGWGFRMLLGRVPGSRGGRVLHRGPVPTGVSALLQPGQRKMMVEATMKGQRT